MFRVFIIKYFFFLTRNDKNGTFFNYITNVINEMDFMTISQ